MAKTCRNRESHTACEASCASYRLSPILLISVLMVMLLIFPELPLAGQKKAGDSRLHFVCNVGYTPQECRVAITILRKALARYPAEALGEWRWVLVRTKDWKEILSVRGFDTDRPAFSYLPKRETFLDGSLVAGVSLRGAELRMIWHMPIEDLLDLAIRHELAHALCNQTDESKTDREAIALKNGMPLSCRKIEEASVANPT